MLPINFIGNLDQAENIRSRKNYFGFFTWNCEGIAVYLALIYYKYKMTQYKTVKITVNQLKAF